MTTNAATTTIDMSGNSLAADASFSARMREFARTTPEADVVIAANRRISWREFWREVVGVARYLEGKTTPTACVGILAENRAEYVSAFMGTVVSGRCAVTLPTTLPNNVLAGLMRDSAPALLFTSPRYVDAAREALETAGLSDQCEMMIWSDTPPVTDNWSTLGAAGEDPDEYPPPAPHDRPFNIVYSSGTTGTPKGILHTHRTRLVMSKGLEALRFDRDAATLISTSMYTNFAIPAMLGILWGGGRIVLMERFEADTFLELAERERATHFYIVPTQVQRLLESPRFNSDGLSASRLVYVAGSLFRRELKDDLLARWPGTLLEVYGLTEGAPVTALPIREFPHKIGSVGRPIGGCEIHIIDDEGRVQPNGSLGEIVGRSGMMMHGYHNRPEATEELVWRDEAGNRFFRSGDIGRFDEDGFLYVLDRKKDMIISGGLNIYAADIESVLATHPDVGESTVVGVPSAKWGETPVACVVLRAGVASTGDKIRAWTNERLAKYQRLAVVHCVDQLPRNAMGKVMKRELRQTLPPVNELSESRATS
jgi:acyl-CoA synthetase (AMP-forming)/AMP-acid ligase II